MKTKIIIAAMLVSLLPLAACGSHKTDLAENESTTSTIQTTNENIIKRNLQLPHFHTVCNDFAVKVYYTQGSKFQVTFEGNQQLFDACKFYVKDNVLHVEHKKGYRHRDVSNQQITLRITAPTIKALTNDGAMEVYADNWKASDLKVKNDGAMRLNISIIDGESVNIDNDGALKFIEGKVKATNVSIKNDGASTISIPFEVRNLFAINNDGSSKLRSSIKAKTYTEKCDGSATDSIQVTAEDISVYIDGAGKVNGDFKGKNVTIHGDGSSEINLAVNCENLQINSDGSSNIKVKGTADNTSFKNEGVTRVDVSELNKF